MSLREKPWYPVIYMFVVTAFFSSILIGLCRFTQDRVDANQRLAFEKAILESLPLDLPPKASSLELHRIFVDRVRTPDPQSGGAYLWLKDGSVEGYALPIEGQGFWDTIKGVIGIAADRTTLTGISFYEQAETPGLGAEITQPPFRSQFPGRKIAVGEKPVKILPVGSKLGPSDVHAVTGATQTSTRLEKIIDEALAGWRASMEAGKDQKAEFSIKKGTDA